MTDQQEAAETQVQTAVLDQRAAAKAVSRWLALESQPRNLNKLLDALEDCITPVPFNLIAGQWFLGTEPLPNQGELDALRAELGQARAELRELKLAAAGGYDMGLLP